MFRNIDGVVDPGGNTLRKMQQLILGGTPEYDPKSLAEWSKGLATRWCNIAMSAIRRYQLADPGELDLWRRRLDQDERQYNATNSIRPRRPLNAIEV